MFKSAYICKYNNAFRAWFIYGHFYPPTPNLPPIVILAIDIVTDPSLPLWIHRDFLMTPSPLPKHDVINGRPLST